VIKRLKAKIERIAFFRSTSLRIEVRLGPRRPTNSGFTTSHIGGITGAGCLFHRGEAIDQAAQAQWAERSDEGSTGAKGVMRSETLSPTRRARLDLNQERGLKLDLLSYGGPQSTCHKGR
jgi:hypothetical protein